MKTLTGFLCAVVMVFCFGGAANASLTIIGTASYDSDGDGAAETYNLIYEDNSIDGGLVWLDYTNPREYWLEQENWAGGLSFRGADIDLLPGFATTIDWSTGWRLPLTQNTGMGDNQTGSEMGHLYYDSLGKPAGGPLGDTSPFSYLLPGLYWSLTEQHANASYTFLFSSGNQNTYPKDVTIQGMAVRPGNVTFSGLWAKAGDDQTVFNEITLDGSQSVDLDGSIELYEWQLHHRGDSAYDRTVGGVSPTVTVLESGFYDVILAVTDNDGNIGTDEMMFSAIGRKGDLNLDGDVDGDDLADFAVEIGD